jgi:hypothetical protein
MNAVAETRWDLPESTGTRLAADLIGKRFAHARGQSMAAWLAVDTPLWRDFADHWGRLTLDRHMADGGAYRLRRYGAFEMKRPGPPALLPHAPYEQPLYINPLNGGVAREFDPLEPSFANHLVLTRLLHGLAQVCDEAEGALRLWNIRLHPYRIRADLGSAGLPTPEGLHRDGVDYIVTMMVGRHHVEGGITQITDADGHPLWERELWEPMELLIADDHATRHAVTPVRPTVLQGAAHRDVLVIAYTRADRPEEGVR